MHFSPSCNEQTVLFAAFTDTEFGAIEDMQLEKHERRMLRQHEFILSDNDLLYCIDVQNSRSRSTAHTRLRLCVPETERKRVMYQYHNINHSGVIHLYDRMREHVWWPSMLKDVSRYVSSCHTCQINKGERENKSVRPMSLPTRPWSHIAIDHVGPFPTSSHGNKYILVIIDRFTRYAEAVAVKDTSAKTTSEAIIERVICRYGLPDVLLSDRGSGFTSELFTHLLKALSIKHIRTTAYHPSSNGAVERFNKTLKKMLKLWVNRQQTDWDVLLPFAIFAYNSSVHSVLHETPHFLNYGQQPKTVVDTITERDTKQSINVHSYASDLCEKLTSVHTQVREILTRINSERQSEIDAKEGEGAIKIGDEVFMHDPVTPAHQSQKFVKRWKGPYVVMRINNNNTSVIIAEGKERLISNDRLRLVRDGLESIEEKHQSSVQRAIKEIQVIDDHVRELVERKRKLTLIQQISDAVIEAEKNESKESSSSSSSTSKDEEKVLVEEDEDNIDNDEEEMEEEVEVHSLVAYSLNQSINLL